MRRGTNNLEVKKLNRNRVFRYVNSKKETSMPEISTALNISTPTVLSIVNELEEKHVIRENGEFESTGGRKAKAIESVKDIRYAVGLDITGNHVGLVCTDLSEKALEHKRVRKPFSFSLSYFREVGEMAEQFVLECGIPKEKILGIGMALPAIIDAKRKVIDNSRALGVFNIPCEEWASCMPYPCEMINDASAAAIAEISGRKTAENIVYLSLSNTVGGAAVFRNDVGGIRFWKPGQGDTVSLYEGDNWRSCEFGHMVIHPGGRMCYCGKQGCLDAYCSALTLADNEDGNLEQFFQKMESGNKAYRKIWEGYLEELLVAVDNLRMCFDCKVVLGGYVGSNIKPYLQEIRRMAAKRDIFGNDGLYIDVCRYQKEASALGAAIFLIEKFIETI